MGLDDLEGVGVPGLELGSILALDLLGHLHHFLQVRASVPKKIWARHILGR